MKRIATAAVLAPVVFLLIWFVPVSVFAVFAMAVSSACFFEYSKMAEKKGIRVPVVRGTAAVFAIEFVFLSYMPAAYAVLAVILIALFAGVIMKKEAGMETLVFTLLGVVYIGVCFSAPILMRNLPEGEKLVLLGCFGVWGADIGAYYAGRAFGKRKLAPAVSPGKTVEGAMGGLLSALLFCFLFSFLFFKSADAVTVMAAGMAGGVIGPLGDLSESMMKRYFGVKDSGSILPGHGALLDRVDAVMFSLPVFYIFLLARGAVW
jgi:phosphatidate cytidylyltransferase